jgi:hypothetical protein
LIIVSLCYLITWITWLVARHVIIKGKAVPLHAMEALEGERRYSSYSVSTSALDGGEWSASRPGRAFTPGERTPSTHCTGGWVGPRAGLDTEVRGKILCPHRGSNPDRPVVQPIVRHYTAWANPAPRHVIMVYKMCLNRFSYASPSTYLSSTVWIDYSWICC